MENLSDLTLPSPTIYFNKTKKTKKQKKQKKPKEKQDDVTVERYSSDHVSSSLSDVYVPRILKV